MNDINPKPDGVTAFYDGDRYVIEDSLGYLLRQVQQSMHRGVDARMEALDLTAMQWGPLLFIAHNKAKTAADIARCGGVDTGAVTRMLDRLEAKGLIARVRSREDKRIVYLELTEAGQEIAAKIPHVLADHLNERLRGFSQAELDSLKSLLRRLLENEQA